MSDPFVLLREAVAWLHLFVAVGGLAVCLLHLRLSGWVWLVAAGFAGQSLTQLVYRVGTFLIERGGVATSQAGFVFSIGSLLGLASGTCVVGGLFAVFRELSASSRRA